MEMSRFSMSGKKGHEVIWPLNLQIKQGVVHKIRPAKWYGKAPKFPIFQSEAHFLAAVEETVYQNRETHADAPSWRQRMTANYEKFYGKKLSFPRWPEIVDQYAPEK